MESAAAPQAAAGAPKSLGGRFKAFRERHHLAFEISFFFAGFLFDVVLLHRIDSRPLLIHQGVYVVLSALLIFVDHRIHSAGREPAGFWGKVAGFRLWVMHFFMGTLLNAFMVFYFRAASGLFAFGFLVVLAVIIVANELPRFRAQGPVVRVALLSFCFTSFLAYLIPVLWGELRSWQYYVSVVLGAGLTYGLWRLFTRFNKDPAWTFKRAVAPGLGVQAALFLLYLAHVVPPVPLSLKHIAMYNAVEVERSEKERHYHLKYVKGPAWRVWERVPSTIKLAPGEKAWAFVRIFAPAKFQDRVAFAWEYDDPKKGWVDWGKPYATGLSGGNEEGYRTFAYTSASRDGRYRVRVLTADGREIGRKTFHIETAADPTALEYSEEVD